MANDIDLSAGYVARLLTRDEFRPFFEEHVRGVFSPGTAIDVKHLLSDEENAHVSRLWDRMGDPVRLYFGVFDAAGAQVGWSFGFQTDAESFYMCNTGVLDGHRGRGIYTALLPVIMQTICAEGFQVIHSRHTMTNNAVLIPKLRAGFIISQFELSDRFGALVHLRYFTNANRRAVMDYRCGKARLPDEVTALLDDAE